MEYQDFLYEFTHTSDHEIKFYDKKMDKVISVDSSIYFLVNVNDKFDLNQLTDDGKEEFKKIKRILKDKNRFIVMNPASNITYDLAEKAYSFELPESVKKNLHSSMDIFVHSLDNDKEFEKYWDFFIEDYMNDWFSIHNLDVVEEDKKYNLCFKWMKLIYKLEPWNYFTDQQLVKIKINKMETYVNILGNAGECYGFTLYYGKKGLCDYNLLANEAENNPNSVLFASLQNADSFYYDYYGSLDEEFYQIINKSGLEFEEGSYPNILSFKEGKFPTGNLDKNELTITSTILKALYIGMLKFIQTKYSNKMKEDQLLEIELTDFYSCKLRTWKNDRRDLINDYGLCLKPSNNECKFIENAFYEVRLDALHHPVNIDNEKMWSYIFLVRDIINNKIIFHTLASYQEDKKALPQIVNELKEFAKNNGFSKKVLVHNFVEFEIVMEAINDQVEIIKGDYSEELDEFLELINNVGEFENKGVIN